MTTAEDDWWIIGSAAVALHGGRPIKVGDVDVLASVRDARAFVLRAGVEARAGDEDALFRSDLLARWDDPPLSVEIMAGFRVRTAEGWQPVRLSTRDRIECGGRELFVPSRDELRGLLLRFGRPKDLERVKLLVAA